MPDRTADDIGARIAHHRRTKGLTQNGLAMRAFVSKSLIAQVESGHKEASPAFTAACARALGLNIATLTEPQNRPASEDDRLRALLGPIRAALDLYDLPPDEEVRPRPLNQLAAAVRAANKTAQAANYRPMAERLPGLLAELHTAAHTWIGKDQAAAWGLLAEAYRCGHTVGIAMGMDDLSATALSRMDWAAQRSADRGPGLRAAREYLRVTAYLRRHDYAACSRLNASGAALVDGAEAGDPGGLVARGQLHLGAAVIAARTGDRDGRAGHLEEARRIAKRTGEDLSTFWFGFGPTNVQVHDVMTLVELGEYDQAVAAADGLRFPAEWLPTRIGHHHFDLARAYHWRNQPTQALAELQRARRVAPGQAKRHPIVRSTVRMMLDSGQRVTLGTRRGIHEYARWVGV